MNKFIVFFLLPLFLGFKFHPMSQSMEIQGKNKSSQFVVENDGVESLAIEVTVRERRMDLNGKEELLPTTKLSVFPPQLIIPPKEKRTIRVVWSGTNHVSSEESFRVIAEQLPVDVNKKKRGTGIQLLMKYQAAFYVTPAEAASKIDLSLVSVSKGSFKFKVKNSGTKHQIIYRPVLTIKHLTNKLTLDDEKLSGFNGENILAGNERIFEIKSAIMISPESQLSLKLEE